MSLLLSIANSQEPLLPLQHTKKRNPKSAFEALYSFEIGRSKTHLQIQPQHQPRRPIVFLQSPPRLLHRRLQSRSSLSEEVDGAKGEVFGLMEPRTKKRDMISSARGKRERTRGERERGRKERRKTRRLTPIPLKAFTSLLNSSYVGTNLSSDPSWEELAVLVRNLKRMLNKASSLEGSNAGSTREDCLFFFKKRIEREKGRSAQYYSALVPFLLDKRS